MTEEQAIKIYFEKNNKAKTIIERLKKWKEDQSVKSNAIDLAINPILGAYLARKYDLPHA